MPGAGSNGFLEYLRKEVIEMAGYGNVRDKVITTSSGSDVKSTQQLKGEAKDSLSGTNSVTEYTTGGSDKGKLGGMPSHT